MTETPFEFDVLTRRGVPLRRFDPGERIFLEDDAGACMYVVRTGRVDVIRSGVLRPSTEQHLRQMALIDDGARNAAAMAREPTEVAVIDKTTFHALIREEPEFALCIMRLLTGRIRRLGRARR
jgi:CRP-like cAMP-binding protein